MEVRYVVGLIVLILTIVSLRDIIFDKLLSSREKNKMYENYTHNTLSKKIDLDVVLSDYNKSLTEKKIDSIHKNESFDIFRTFDLLALQLYKTPYKDSSLKRLKGRRIIAVDEIVR